MAIKQILAKELARIKPSEEERKKLDEKTKKFCIKLEKSLKKKKIKASVFIGGSLAKNTILKKDVYDIDIFARFDSSYKDEELANLLARVVKGKRIHGSRNYFQIKQGKIIFEIIPVIKVSRANQARNVTDLSFFHVKYVLNKIKKNPKLADEIMLAKSFCYAQGVYGAENYISGFSGYALELLVIYYESFVNFLKAMYKVNEKLVLDPEKHYKNKQEIMNSINEAKLASPIIFVDPTNKNRNALAALSKETFLRFQKASRSFSRKPSSSFFKIKEINVKNYNLVLKARTDRQEGDIAGSKLKKFFGFLAFELNKRFIVEKKDFEYDSKKEAKLYFKIKPQTQLIINGPPIDKSKDVIKFKKKHKTCFVKNNRIYAREKIKSLGKFLKEFKAKNKEIIKAMGIIRIDLVKD